MSTNREIITLQLGDYANHVATHYWNLEWENANLNPSNIDNKDNDNNTPSTNTSESNTTNPYKSWKYTQLKRRSKPYHSDHSGKPSKHDTSYKNINPNICFHSTITSNKTTYTPRTIIFATQGSEGNINSNIYDESSNTKNTNISTWNNNINIVHKQQSKTENKTDCKFWSDYLLPTLHNKSLFRLDGIHYFSSPFYSYSTGYDLLNSNTTTSNDLLESIDDRIRYFVESCDWFQGFQIFENSYNSFSGFLPTIINTIHDDYNNKCILLYDLLPSKTTMEMESNMNKLNKQSIQIMNKRFKLNSIISTAQIWNEVSNIIPINANFWDNKNRQNIHKKFYNTSIIGSCLHHFTNGVRLNNSNIRLMDIINCYVKTNCMKMSMLSSCSTHLDLNMNYQAIDSIEKLLMFDMHLNQSAKYKSKKRPFFPRLSCLGPVSNEYLSDNYILNSKIFGEYSCLSGSDLYGTNDKIIEEWKQNKMILAEKQGSSKSDIDLWSNKWTYDRQKQNYHLKLMTKLASKTDTTLKWHLINKAWKLPSVHPFYFDDKKDDNNEEKGDNEYDEEMGNDNINKNKYSIWSSGWTSSIIGESYLNESAGNVNQIIKYGIGQKMFGDVELDLDQYQEELTALANAYSGEKDIDIE
eukprot:271628_1